MTEQAQFAPPQAEQMMGQTLTEAYANPNMQISNLDAAKAQVKIAAEAGIDGLLDEKLNNNLDASEAALSPEEKRALNEFRIGNAAVTKEVSKPVYIPASAEDQAMINAAAVRTEKSKVGYGPISAEDQAQIDAAAVRGPNAYDTIISARDAQAAVFAEQQAQRDAGESWADIQTPGASAAVR